ncbi:iron complex outermembrane recepter protein [Lutimaribacter pacificus]|uniref:Iron complex outermembrane recepter protein n=1 Tax=Lutimaribacter pacificus TaxID=391948 RepID=A0A1H0N787_9RHOB|nr:TonB-dependent siderophore receptor [Lutimaribacter pacificus]SDO88345.1 iron complex outermembrane recepter protein [Lutimaribacter pacificus]SHK86496.1 iron complex outermembrane recepter protein [Lutimaribacter pacificus]
MGSPSTAHRPSQLRPARSGAALFGCTALVAIPLAVSAQEGSGSEPYRLGTIFVNVGVEADDDANSTIAKELWTGGKVATSVLDTPASVSVVTQKEIEQRNADKVEDVLEYTPGIVTDYYGTDDRNDYYLVRGFQASTYRDGLTLGSMRGVREEPYAFERVEIMKGGNSTLFGTSDPGGTLNFVTKTPKFERFGEIYGSFGSNNHKELGFDFGDILNEAETLSYRIVGKVQDADLEYDGSKDDERFFLGSIAWAPTDRTKLTFSVDYLKRDGTPNSGGYPLDRLYDRRQFFGEPGFNYHDVERLTVSAGFQHEFDNGLRLNANLRYSDLNDDFGYIYLSDNAARVGTMVDRFYFGTDSTAEELIGNVIAQYDTSFGNIDSSTLAGIEFRDASTTSSSIYGAHTQIDISNPVYTGAPTGLVPYSVQANDFTTKSVFLQQNLSFSDKLIATAGVRHDWLDITNTDQLTATTTSADFSETSYRGALTYKFTNELSAYASYVQSVAPPSIGTQPERGEQYEIGLKYQPESINALFTASLYDLTKKNVVVPVVLPSGAIERQTIGESRVRGLELEARMELAEGLTLFGGYSYQMSDFVRGDVRGVTVDGNQFASVPNHLASLWLNYDLPSTGTLGDMSVGIGLRYVGPYYYNVYNDNGKSPDQLYVDASFSYEFAESTALNINVSNLFDKQYVVGRGTADYYNNGRTITVALNHSW